MRKSFDNQESNSNEPIIDTKTNEEVSVDNQESNSNEPIIDTKTNEEVSFDNQVSNSNKPFSMFFKRPRGRAPKGKSWDQEKGIWV